MPLALHVLPEQRLAVVVAASFAWCVFDPDVVESLGAAFEPDLHDRAGRVEQAQRLQPELARLVGMPVSDGGNGLGHRVSPGGASLRVVERRRWLDAVR